MRPRRVAFAVAGDRELVLGQADTHSLRLAPHGLTHFRLDFPDDAAKSPLPVAQWSIPWDDVVDVVLRADSTHRRRPGLLPMARAFLLEAVGWAAAPPSSDVVITVSTSEARHEVEVAGYVGSGYFRGDLHAVQGLVALLVSDSTARAALADPARILDALAEVGSANVDVPQAQARLAKLLAG